MKTIQIETCIRPNQENVKDNVDSLLSLFRAEMSDEKLLDKCELAMTEVLNNIVEHAFPSVDNEMKKVIVRIGKTTNSMLLTFKDYCQEWNIDEYLPDREKELFISEDYFSVRGRGLKIIKILSTSFKVSRINNSNQMEILIA